MSAMPASQSVVSEQGLFLEGNPHMKFVFDGRTVSGGSAYWNLEHHGFTFFGDSATELSPEEFHNQPGNGPEIFTFDGHDAIPNPGSVPSWTQTYYKEIAEMCKTLVPCAEAVSTYYHVLRKANATDGADHKLYYVAPRTHSQADRVVSGMLGAFQHINHFPANLKERIAQQVHCDAMGGVDSFIRELVAGNSMPKSKNDYALMPDASPELMAEVSSLLHDDEYYSFVKRVRSIVQMPGRKQDAGEEDESLNVPPLNPESHADVVVSQMIAVFDYVDYFPADFKDKLRRQLQSEGEQGVQDFVTEWVEAHSQPKSDNPHALMPDASPALKAKVTSLLLNEVDHYRFVARARCALLSADKSAGKSADKSAFQPPAVGSAHTDVSAEGFLKQFRQQFPQDHPMSAVSPGHKRRVLFLKFWRNMVEAPIVNHHLAMLDKSSLDDSDMHEHEINFKGMPIKQNRFNDDIDFAKLRWVYFPCMRRDEVLCFQQGDLTIHGAEGGDLEQRVSFPESRQNHAVFHGAFYDPTAPVHVPPRQSIECAAFVFLPQEPDVPARL
jgi:hypothetical protein